jgi:hypothetical protein
VCKLSLVALGINLALAAVAAHAQGTTGPQSSHPPYIVPTAPGWQVVSLITVGDSAKHVDYRLVGIPDGMGALPGKFAENGDYAADKAFMTIFVSHELGATSGVPRAHGATGAFVSQWTLHLDSKQVVGGEDLITKVMSWDNLNKQFVDTTGTTRFGRFCSADLPAKTAFYNPATGRGFDGRLYMKGEESGNEGRAYATVVSGDGKGTAYQLPFLGRLSRENSLAHPNAGDKTLVVGLDDSSPGQVYLYVGDKQRAGNPAEQAGLQHGKLYGVRVTNGGAHYANGLVKLETGAINGTFDFVDLSDIVASDNGSLLQTKSTERDVTEFARPEDGHWDTRHPNVFYWVTTGRSGATARLYKFTFDSIATPTGGTVETVLDAASLVGTDGQTARSFDNMTVDADGNILIQEDPGGSDYIAKVWKFNPVTRQAVQIFESDRDRFLPGAPNFLTVDEENSGVIEVTELVASAQWYEPGRRYYLTNTQAHYNIVDDPELVQGGQVQMIVSPKVGGAGQGKK